MKIRGKPLTVWPMRDSASRRKLNDKPSICRVEELARSIAAVGLMNPITVTQDNTLIAGLHHLEAVKLLGWTEIECTVSDADGLQAELAGMDENFVRAGLSHRELGDLLLRRKELYEAIHPETQQGQRNGQTARVYSHKCINKSKKITSGLS